jgi:hypothetical protein
MIRSKLYYHIYLFGIVLFLVFLSFNSTVQGTYYNDDNERYSIWYPDNWQSTSVDGADIAFMDPKYDDFRENINVVSVFEFGVRNTKEYVLDACNEGIKEIRKMDSSMTVVKQPIAGQINGHWSATYVFDMKQYGETLRFSQTIIASQGYSYAFIITCTALPHTFDDYETTFSRSINSFEVLNEPADSLFSGLFLAVGMGALVGGIAGGIIFYMVYSKKKKEKEAQTTRPLVTSKIINPITQTTQPPVTSKVIKTISQTKLQPQDQEKVQPVQSPPEKTLPPPPPPPPPPES